MYEVDYELDVTACLVVRRMDYSDLLKPIRLQGASPFLRLSFCAKKLTLWTKSTHNLFIRIIKAKIVIYKGFCTLFILLSLSGCFSTYEYKDCGVLYEQSVGSPLGNNGLFTIDSWGDAMTVMRGIPPDRFFQNNACMLTGKVEEK